MVKKRVNIKDFSRVFKNDTEANILEVRNAIKRGVVRSFPEVVKKSPVDTGQYASSWALTEEEKGILLGNFAPHAPIIEYGARPFTPPIGPLLAWAKRVLGDGSQPPNYSSEVWALAKATQKKISEKGMMPKHVLENSLDMIVENIKREIQEL